MDAPTQCVQKLCVRSSHVRLNAGLLNPSTLAGHLLTETTPSALLLSEKSGGMTETTQTLILDVFRFSTIVLGELN